MILKLISFLLISWFIGISHVEAQSLKLSFSIYASAAAIDLHSTYRFLHYGIREVNPLVQFDNPSALIATSAAIDATTCYAIYHMWGKNHRKAASIILYSIAAIRVGLAVHNYRIKDGREKIAK